MVPAPREHIDQAERLIAEVEKALRSVRRESCLELLLRLAGLHIQLAIYERSSS